MWIFLDYVKSRLLVIYLMLMGTSLPRLWNLLVSFYSMALRRPTSGRVPPQLIIKLTSRCNYACIMCPKTAPDLSYYDSPRDLPYPVLEQLLRDNAKHLSLVKLFGGEPLYHREIGRILDLLNELGLKFTITTNAFLLTPEICGKLTRNCVRVFVSIDSPQPQMYASMRRGGDLTTIVSNLHGLQRTLHDSRSRSPVIKAIMTVFSFNLSAMPDMVQFCAAHGIRYLVFQEGVAYGNAAVEKEHLLQRNIERTERMIQRTRAEGQRRRVVVEFDFPWCRQAKRAASSSTHGAECGPSLRRCFYLYFTMLIQQDNEYTFCFGTYNHLAGMDGQRLSDIWNAPDGLYYSARTQLRNGTVPSYCSGAYAARGKCALTMVR